jgi:hypothetical protein
MTRGHRRQLAIVLAGSLCGAFAVWPATDAADAQGQPSLAAPTVAASSSSSSSSSSILGVSLPDLNVTLPSVNVTVPTAGLPVPEVNLNVPSVTVTVPEVTVSTPVVSVTTPSVSASTPSVSASTSSSSTTVSAETPSSGTGTTTSSGGSGTEASAPSSGGEHKSSTSSTPSEPPSSTIRYSGNASSGSSSSPGTGSPSHSSSSPAASVRRAAGESSRRRAATPTHARSHGTRRRAAADPPPSRTGAGSADTRTGTIASHDARTPPRAKTHAGGNALDSIGKHIPLPLPVPNWSKPIILLLLALALFFAVRSRMAALRARKLEGQTQTLMADVDAMQVALVPEIPDRVGGLAVSVAYRPAEGPAAGGDFYDVFSPERGKVAIILGDVAGHGHEALTQAALTRYTLRAYLQAGMEPRAALALAGRVLGDPSAEHFATVVVGMYDTRVGRLTFASAGHPAPIIHGLQTREPPAVCASPPIGWTVPTGRRQSTVSLPCGSVVCFFSDGLIEARCKDDLLGRERLSEMLDGLGSPADAAKLLARVRTAASATPDDMAACILVSEMAVVSEHVHTEELEVDAKAIAGEHARRFLETCQVSAAEIESTLARAGDIAAVFGTALLRAELDSTAASVQALPPGATPQAPELVGVPSLPVS